MTMNLDAFIQKATSQVRNAKGQGKVAQKARKELGKSQLLLDNIKAEIQAIARACERKEWKPRELKMIRYTHICACCKEHEVHLEAVYVVKDHKNLGILTTRITPAEVSSFENLPRTFEEMAPETHLCSDCFLSFNPAQLSLDFEGKDFSQRKEVQTIENPFEKLIPKNLLLTFKPSHKTWSL